VDSTIRRFNSSDSISELTLLIRRAYKQLADMGFNYTGSYQDDEITRQRISRGECYVLVEGGALIGSIMLYPPNEQPWPAQQWYAYPGVASCGQFAVEPRLQRSGRGAKLMDFVENRAAEIGAVELALDTSEGADHLIRFYTDRGYRFVEYIQHEGKTYRSMILSKALERSALTGA
jgi:GNAT superfamily N-acetyltransferase